MTSASDGWGFFYLTTWTGIPGYFMKTSSIKNEITEGLCTMLAVYIEKINPDPGNARLYPTKIPIEIFKDIAHLSSSCGIR